MKENANLLSFHMKKEPKGNVMGSFITGEMEISPKEANFWK
jgi:hypothetical protein